jgi:ATP-dependent DNA helicase DinG
MTELLLDSELKSRIQGAYSRWLEARDFNPRRGQREMIATIARVLTAPEAPRIAVLEAGTGTGKTAAYALAAIPIAQRLEKRLVIATATIALQEQILFKDLPDLAQLAGLEFSFALAKGRQRYVCLKRLDDRLRGDAQADLPMYEFLEDATRVLFAQLLDAFATRKWDGELDSWADGIEAEDWRMITTDHRGCTNHRCGFFKQCPFFKARNGLEKADVVIANLDLVLADLALGGGAVLPEPEDTIYVLDEAHHLPDKTQQHFTVQTRLRSTLQWLDQVAGTLGSMAQRFGRPPELVALAQQITELAETGAAQLAELAILVPQLEYEARDEHRAIHRFALGRVPVELAQASGSAAPSLHELSQRLECAHEMLQEVVDGTRLWKVAHEAEDWLPAIGQQVARALAVTQLLEDYQQGAESARADRARWISQVGAESAEDYELTSAPIETGALLKAALWSRGYAVVCTSATLAALGRFDRFLERAGLEDVVTARIASPFNYAELASLHVPNMQSDPRDPAAHTDEISRMLPDLLATARSALVLFTSWRQLNDVVDRMPEQLTPLLRIQGRGSRTALLDDHRRAIDAGEQSYLIGVASFAEGVDLPDDYCRHVIIAKLPFAVPDDPIGQTVAEWLEHDGRNPFFETTLPEASMRLIQACGRLIRHEADFGRVTLLDRRVVTARYGATLLDALPPFRRELG